ncbi:MAG: Cytosolic copper metallochaperone [Icmadophila ericetorum]|nr:Cytosolic copper metallochaperone [Icmadophila ericetorum]
MAETQAAHHYKFGVVMTCGGCSGAVERALKKLDGITSLDVKLNTEDAERVGTADVYAGPELTYETVLEKIKKTGKTVKSGEADGQEMAI